MKVKINCKRLLAKNSRPPHKHWAIMDDYSDVKPEFKNKLLLVEDYIDGMHSLFAFEISGPDLIKVKRNHYLLPVDCLTPVN